MKSIVILGSTGSIGTSALKVLRAFPGKFRVLGLAAGSNHRLLARQIAEFRPRFAALADPAAAARLKKSLPGRGTRVLSGPEGVAELVMHEGVDTVLSAIVGAAGLVPTWRAIERGLTVAIANKEPLVMAGELMTAAARASGAVILPVDSEHHALHTALRGIPREAVARLIITASGGPFRDWPAEKIRTATVAQALRHPSWRMGPKITIDSATLMNKGLEIIEARWLFDIPEERIGVVVHPESIIHGMIELTDTGTLAYLSLPDMRLPISAALNHPDLPSPGLPRLDLARLGRLTFQAPDTRRFPCLPLARKALRLGASHPAVLNAANEVAVQAFLAGRIDFGGIHRVIERTLARHAHGVPHDIEAIQDHDRAARREAAEIIVGRRKRPNTALTSRKGTN